MEENIERIKFSEIATALTDQDHPFPPRLLRGFSDLSPRDLKEFILLWKDVPVTRKQSILEDLEDITEKDTLVCFDEMAKVVVDDPDPRVRVLALRLLWECEDPRIVPGVIDLLLGDPDESVRSTAASLLGRFVYLGELDEIPDTFKISAVKNLLDVVSGEDLQVVRLRALESLGYSGHVRVPGLIKNAFESSDSQWVASALCAMGRSADEQWAELVLEKLDSDDSDILFEAVRAAGELELTGALDRLFAVVEERESEDDVRLAAIWSLSQIGGSEVKDKFKELLKDSESDEEVEWIEKALENMELSSSSDSFNFFNFKPMDEEENEEDFDEDYEEDELEFTNDEYVSLDDDDEYDYADDEED